MTKRLAVLVGMLAVLFAAAVPALAQSFPPGTITVTGVVEVVDTDPDGNPAYGITDEATGEGYRLGIGSGPGSPISEYEGERVTIDAVPRSTPDGTVLDIVAFAPERGEGPPSGEEIAVTFELAVEGETPAGTQFFAGASQQAVGLDDPDGDGTYTGTLTLPADFGGSPVPVAILAGTPEDPQQTIKDFGEVVLEDGDNFSASISFEGDGGPSPGEAATLTFELTVEGEPPEDTRFFGAPGEGGGRYFDAEGNRLRPVPLADPDSDGVYTGSTTLANPDAGPVISLPVQIVRENGGNIEVIRDFGVVPVDGDETFRASVSFEGDRAGTTSPETTTPGNSDGSGGVGSGDGSSTVGGVSSGNNGGSGSSGSADSDDGSSSGSASGGSGNSGANSGGIRGALPSTGGIILGTLGAGALLIGGGLLVRRLAR